MRLRIVEGFSQPLLDMLEQGAVDVAILNGPMQLTNVPATSLMTEALCLIGRTDDARLMRMTKIKLLRLAGLPLLMTGVSKSGVRLELEAAARASVVLNPVVEVETLSVAARPVEEGLGFTVHFAAVLQDEIEAGRLVAIPIEGLRLRRVPARASDRPPSRATEVLMGILRAVVQERVDAGRWPHAMLDR